MRARLAQLHDSDGSEGDVPVLRSGLWVPEAPGAGSLPVGGATGDVLTKQSATDGDADWATPSGGGGSGAPYLPLDVPPTSAHAKDDEFPGTSLDAKWTAITSNSGNGISAAVADGICTIEPSASGTGSTSRKIFGYRQAAPATSFAAAVKVSDDFWGGGDNRFGVWVADAAGAIHMMCGLRNPGAGATRVVSASYVSTGQYSETVDWGATGATDWGSNVNGGTLAAGPWLWYKIGWDSATSTLTAYWSHNGVSWHQHTTRTGQSQPTKMGFGMWSINGDLTADRQLFIDWFRVTV